MSAVVVCTVPLCSALVPQWTARASFLDAYRAPLRGRPPAEVVALFFAIFGHHPRWLQWALLARNRLARAVGLAVPDAAQILHPTRQAQYAVGDTIGPWPVYHLSAHELIAGRDNAHLDFRLSVLREAGRDGPPSVVVSTVCVAHNRFGRVYLACITPFHRWGVQWIMRAAVRAGRL